MCQENTGCVENILNHQTKVEMVFGTQEQFVISVSESDKKIIISFNGVRICEIFLEGKPIDTLIIQKLIGEIPEQIITNCQTIATQIRHITLEIREVNA